MQIGAAVLNSTVRSIKRLRAFMSVLYVSPIGQDSNEGSVSFPLRTIARALELVSQGGAVQLAAGKYQAGEQFPLQVPDGVTVSSDDSRSTIVEGGGLFGGLNVAVVLGDRAQVRGVTITNPQGSGILTTDGNALIIGNRLVGSRQSGVVVTGSAHPFVAKNEFIENGATGLSMSDGAKGEVRQNRFERTGYGITLSDRAAPLAIDNRLVGNQCAFSIANQAKPVLRKNQAIASQESALWMQDRAQPDVGQPQDLGYNWFEGKTYDVRNDAISPLVSAGNQINPVRVRGLVSYLPSEVPGEVAIPPVLIGNVEPVPLPPTTAPEDADSLAGADLNSRFNDLVGHWSAPFVEALAEKGLVKGFLDGTFGPDNQVTRAEFAALVTAAFPQVARENEVTRFPDVPAGFWGARAIRQAQAQGFLSGFPDGSFRPNAPLTKVQAIVSLVNGLGLGAGRSEALLVYRDRAQIPSYAIDAVAAATNRSMVASYPDPTVLKPLSPISRAETTALVHQAMVAKGATGAIVSPFILSPEDASPSFTDLPSQHWARDYIDPMVEAGWLSGFRDNTFRPDAPITRAQFATVLVTVFEAPAKRPAIQFRDVEEDFWAAAAIGRAYRAEFISGFPDLTFDPNYPLTKLQSLLALVSGLNLQAVSAPDLGSLAVYSDRAAIPNYARSAIASATQLGLVFNHPTPAELRPSRVASRAEVCAMVYQSLMVADRVPAVTSPYQVVLS